MGANELTRLQLNVARWGNSLAVRLPAELARELSLTEGSTVELQRDAETGHYALLPRPVRVPFDKAAWQAQAQAHLDSMPASESVMAVLRDGARY